MSKEEIKHFKALLKQGILRHKNILLDDKFQEELLIIIKEYEKIQQENQQLKEEINNKKSSIKALKIALKERTEERDRHYDKEHLYKCVIDKASVLIKKALQENLDDLLVDLEKALIILIEPKRSDN